MELVKQIKHAKKLNVKQLCQYNEMIQPYSIHLDDFMKSIYNDLIHYFSSYLTSISSHVYILIQDQSRAWECENKIIKIRHDLELTILEPIQHKFKLFIRNKNLEFIKIVTLYFMLNIPMIIHLYSDKVEQIYRLIDKHK